MKNLSFIFLLFCSAQVFAQTKGITYQAVIYNPSGESLPGVNNANAPMASKNVCLQFSIVDASSQVEYQESISTTTDEFGMVNLVIGNGIQTSGYATSFSNISWSADQKSLKVALDIAGQCTDFVDISSQKFEAVPYAFSATTADYITGILPIENGGTNASTVLGAKTNLGLENVDNTSDLNKPISTATQAALDLKEDQVNKSTSTTLGTSDILYPTQNAVKTYVDAGATNINAAIANEAAIRAAADAVLTTDLATEVTNRINGDNTLTTNLATEVTNRINGDNTLTTNLGVEVLNRTNADNVLTTNLATEVTNRTNADLLKEDLANKSTATTLGTSNILYPTQNAVKTYVDATATTNTTAINNEAAIRAAADVVLTNDLATEVTNRTNADLLKENTANKSTATSLGTSNVLFPTQNAVKSYVDASATTNAAAVTNEAAIRAAADVVLTNNLATEVTNRTNADLLKENLANKSTNTTLGTSDVLYPTQNAVKTYVDANAVNGTNALNNEAAIRAAADVVLTNNLATEVTNRINGDNNLATSIATEVTNRTNADLLKEDLTNKSTNVILDGSSNIKYPTVKSMKDYVDAGTATSTGAITNEAAIRAAADVVLTNNLATEVTNRTNADLLKEDLVNKSNNIVVDGTSTVKYPTTKTVKDYVDLNATTAATNLSNETAARIAADNTLTTNLNTEALNRINADLLKENAANKSTATTLGNSDVLFPTQNAVKTYVDANATSNSTAISNEAAIRAAADAVLTSNLATEVAARTNADNTLTTNLANEVTNRTNADLLKENTANKSTATGLGTSDVLFPTQNAVKTYVDATATSTTSAVTNEAAIRAAADVTLTNNLATEITNRTNADLLKENTANKSTATALGTSDILFPTQNAVKTYVDASTSTGISNEAAIRAAADATLTTNLAAEVTNRTNADLLKENTANKSTATALGTSDVLFPTQNAVKTYVDASTFAGTTGLNNEAAIRAAADAVLTNNLATEVTNRTNADFLKENTANKSTATTLGTSDVLFPTQNAVKSYVDASATTTSAALSNEASIRAAADAVLTNNLATEVSNRTNADLLKENAANKSTATALGNSDVLFPTQNAVKTYVDANATSNSTAISNEAAIRAAADVVLTTNLATEVTNRTNADNTLTTNLATEVTNRTNADLLKENTANKSTATTLGTSDVLFPTQNAVKMYVDASATSSSTALANEAAIRAAADVTLTNNLATEITNRTNADLLKENTANKSTATALGTSDVLFPTQNAVKSYVDASAIVATNAVTNEAVIRAAADAVLTTNLATEIANRTNAVNTLTTNLATEVTSRTNADLLKENTANKSASTSLGNSNVLYPTQNAVKSYVDASATSNTTALNNEASIRAAADVVLTNNIATEVTNRTNADLLKENSANKSANTALGTSDVLFPTQNAVKSYVDANASSNSAAVSNEAAIRAAADLVLTNDLATETANRVNADAILTTNLNNEASIRAAADATLTNSLTTETNARIAGDNLLNADLTTEIANRTSADQLKEDLSNKSTSPSLGTSNVLYPSQYAVKTYVDINAANANSAVNNEAAIRANADIVLTNNLTTETNARIAGDATLSTNLATEITDRTNGDAALTTNLATEVTNRTNADNVLSASIVTEGQNRTSADQLKEDLVNKSTAITLGTSNVLYPTQNAVKSYVDAATAAGTSGLSNEAAIRAAADVVLTNNLSAETAARTAADATLTTNLAAEATARTAAEATLTTNLATEVTNRTNADATLTSDLAAEVTNRTNADLLKENLTNKSTTVTLGTSDLLYPTQNAVKTYVDASTAAGSAGVSNEAAIRAAADVVLTNNLSAETAARTAADATLTSNLAAEVTNRTNADLLKENLANKSTTVTLGTSDLLYPTQNAVKTYVDASTAAGSAGVSNEAAIRAAADVVLTNNLSVETTARTAADATLTTNLATEVTNRTNADLLKENLANKSTTVTLGTSDLLYPTQNAVKTYVDASTAAGSAGVSNEAAIRAAADVVLTNNLSVETTARTAADATLTTNLATEVTNRTNADLLKENLANKSTTVTLGTSDLLYPTQNAVKTYVDASTAAGSAGVSNEASIRAAADVVLTNNLSTEITNRTNADLLKENLTNKSTTVTLGTSDLLYPTQNAVKTYVDASTAAGSAGVSNEASIRAAADVLLTNNLSAEISNRTNADLLKENLSNKSTTVTLGTSDLLYPTQNAVKTYVDASTAAGSAGVSNEASIRAAADATLTSNLSAEITNRTNADLLKENLSNKSTTVTLGTSDVLYPTQNAVKTYVDASTAAGSAGVSNEAAIRAAADVVLTNNLSTEITNRTNADLLKENLANKSTTVTLGTSDVLYPTQNAVKTYVDASTAAGSAGVSNEASIRAAADATLTSNLSAEITNRTNADLLKENLANKSTTVTLGTSDLLYPTQNAVKSYVDASTAAGSAGVSNEASIRAAADVVLTNNLSTEITNRTNADLLKENLANKSTTVTLGTSDVLYPTQNAVKTYVDASTASGSAGVSNEAAIRAAADVVLTNDLATEVAARTAADLLKENTANKSTNVILDGASDVKFPSVKAVKTYVDTYSTINSISTVSANYTALITDYTILTNNSSGAFTLTLPNAANYIGKVYVIRKVDESNNVLNFSPALKLTESTMISSINHPKTIRIQSNGTSWYIID